MSGKAFGVIRTEFNEKLKFLHYEWKRLSLELSEPLSFKFDSTIVWLIKRRQTYRRKYFENLSFQVANQQTRKGYLCLHRRFMQEESKEEKRNASQTSDFCCQIFLFRFPSVSAATATRRFSLVVKRALNRAHACRFAPGDFKGKFILKCKQIEWKCKMI